MIRIGIIGCGSMGLTHLQAYQLVGAEKVKVVAVTELRAEKREHAQALCDCEVFETADELLEKAEVDAVDICLPSYMHAEYTIRAMKKNFDIFVEKPLCLSAEDADLMVKTQKETGVKCMVGLVLRSWDEYVWLKEAKEDGRFGKIESGYFKRLSPLPMWSQDNWFIKPECSGGAMVDLHIHDVDYIRYLFGEPEDVNSVASRGKDGIIGHMFTTYKFPDNVAVCSECTWELPQCFVFSAEYRVKFEKALVEYIGGKICVYPEDGEAYTVNIDKICVEESDRGYNISNLGGYYNELEYFIDCLNAGEEPTRATIEDAAKSLKLALREIESAGGLFLK